MIDLGKTMLGFASCIFPIVSIVMTIWEWPLAQTILDGYTLKEHLVAFNETHIPDIDDVGIFGVKKKKYSFHKKKQNTIDSKGYAFTIDKVLLEESMYNVHMALCCSMNCCQHFLQEKTLLRQEFWSLLFENHKTYGLDIPRSLHMKGDGRWQKFITIQGLDICKIAWY